MGKELQIKGLCHIDKLNKEKEKKAEAAREAKILAEAAAMEAKLLAKEAKKKSIGVMNTLKKKLGKKKYAV